ncbi:MAG TPA: YfbU family protein [Acidiphilium sp.]|uniref:YfbU family protein n=1 Tax=unclassified Acidiphilium TaxID=2617493 RepID=UPI000BC5C86D|nr:MULTISPECIES: YfbU family protein [unclassified Acidiphilium]OYV89007.1 MAG: hypothetical protein B7Z57_14015 [Acidiphilium sp. 37-60-79]OZB22106.1 MAG: hypothetical protein B7X49_17305 [Acidiphilium sp. 34-64-41]HQT89599.1 YfbU family protein [Acidiphilium sp.]
MTPKSERFEMRLDPDLLEQLDTWRAQQGGLPSRAQAIRRLIEAGAVHNEPATFKPGNAEKLIIWLLTEMLKAQPGYKNSETINLIQDVIQGGHFWALDWEMQHIFHNYSDSPAAVKLVVDTLDMWSFIEAAFKSFSSTEKKKLEENVGLRGKKPKFLGFDGNHETEYMGIASFLVEKLGRFSSFKGRDFNSHSPSVDRYRRMFSKFEEMRISLIGQELTVEQVTVLLKL